MTPDKPEVPRAKRGTAKVWVPAHADPDASFRLRRLTPHERAAVVRLAGFDLLTKSLNPAVRALGVLMADAVRDGDPLRFIRDAGFVSAGGAHSFPEQEGRRLRNAAIRQLASTEPFVGLTALAAARLMRKSFARYASGQWARDRDAGVRPQAGAAVVWFDMITRGTKMPRNLKYIARIISRRIQ